MGSAKVIIKQQDRSAIVPALSGIEIGTVINSKWGPITPRLVTDPTVLANIYSTPDNKKGSSWNGAELLLANSNKVWISRAIHDDARYSASLVRHKIDTPDFNSYPQPGARPDLIVSPIMGGIGLTELDSFTFPQYVTSRVYENTTIKVLFNVSASSTVEVSGLTGTNGYSFSVGDLISFGANPGDSSDFYEVLAAESRIIADRTISLSGALTASVGDEVKKMVGSTATSYSPPVYVMYDASATNQLVVDNHDLVLNNEEITVDNGTTKATVTSKDIVNRTASVLELNSPITQSKNTEIHYMVSNEFEYRDAFLVVATYPGDMGNKIKVGTRASVNYANAFILDVYVDGALEESFEVTREQFLDGFGNQMYIETKINGISRWITVKDNVLAPDALPLVTNYGVWRRNHVDLFKSTAITLVEDVVKDDVIINVTDATTLLNGSRIKFSVGGPEYKVLSKTGNAVTIDRPILESKIAINSNILMFDATNNDPDSGIFNGSQYYKFSKVSNLTDHTIDDQYTMSGQTGVVLDAGTNNVRGGSDGSPITVYDIITAFKKMDNKEKYKISIFCDNGFAYPEVAIAIDEIQKKTNLSHGYLSVPYAAEIAADPVTAVKDYRNSTNLNTEFCSIFTGWIQVTDVYNQTRVWVAPSVFGVNAQSFVTRNYYIFTPAAGWVYGRLNGLDISVKYEEGERDVLVDAQINPIRYREGWGLAIWGNETLYTRPSPLQLRSVAMLLIILKYGLENYLEYKLFAMNNDPTWTEVENAVTIFIRDTLYTPGGLYGFQVSVKKVITDTDIDNRKMPLFVGIQPTMDIKEIPVTLGIFNKSVAITV